ncbi:MAG TPA: transposase [Steroidobacteraceae bacterium]|jgi:REP element-mobilizing transposase RayT|nr:transposase [Steroidobacteraceae bacterium]
MPRRLRIHLPGGFYHVTLRGNHQHDVFFTEADRHLLDLIVARAIEKFGARIHAYCWMTNHLHLLMQVGAEPLARPMRQIAAEYARAIQAKLGISGHFFERRYHALLVDADSYLLELLRYIHLNPVRAGIVDEPANHRWSSHHNYVGSRVDSWVTTDFLLGIFARERNRAVVEYLNFLRLDSDVPWEPPDRSQTQVLGDDRFLARIGGNSNQIHARQKLAELIDEACKRFEIDPARLDSPVRDAYLTKARAWIAYQAGKRGVATLSAVARALGRHEATIRYAIRSYPDELD